VDRQALIEMCSRIEDEYQPRFDLIDGGVNPWANGTTLGVEILFGDGSRRKGWGTSARYARRRWPFGKPIPFRPVEDAEVELRNALDRFLAAEQAGGLKES